MIYREALCYLKKNIEYPLPIIDYLKNNDIRNSIKAVLVSLFEKEVIVFGQKEIYITLEEKKRIKCLYLNNTYNDLDDFENLLVGFLIFKLGDGVYTDIENISIKENLEHYKKLKEDFLYVVNIYLEKYSIKEREKKSFKDKLDVYHDILFKNKDYHFIIDKMDEWENLC